MHLSHYLSLPMLLLPLACAGQALSISPGLWEHDLELHSASGRIEQALAIARAQLELLPPQQRQMLEGMLTQQGVRFDLTNQRLQSCITAEEASSGVFVLAGEGGCTQSGVSNTGAGSRISYVCPQGEGEVVFRDSTTYTGRSSMSMDFNGMAENISVIHNGRWLGASCAALGL